MKDDPLRLLLLKHTAKAIYEMAGLCSMAFPMDASYDWIHRSLMLADCELNLVDFIVLSYETIQEYFFSNIKQSPENDQRVVYSLLRKRLSFNDFAFVEQDSANARNAYRNYVFELASLSFQTGLEDEFPELEPIRLAGQY